MRILLDTDPGIDDALAIFLALASPEITLEAITTVSGNVFVDHTTRNALSLLELAGRTEIPVARGCDRPLISLPVEAAYVHGDNGLGGAILPEPQLRPLEKHAVDVIIETVLAAPGEITIVAVGPLTNLALALRREPRLASAVREVFIMGGALRVPGNVTPCAEFNIFVDAQAAQIVMQAGWPIRLVTLDTTNRTLLKRSLIGELARGGKPVPVLMKQLFDYYCDVFGLEQKLDAIHMHDPLCMATVIRPDLVEWEQAYVEVELAGKLSFGETVGFFHVPGQPFPHTPNVLASVDVHVEDFVSFYMERIQQTFA